MKNKCLLYVLLTTLALIGCGGGGGGSPSTSQNNLTPTLPPPKTGAGTSYGNKHEIVLDNPQVTALSASDGRTVTFGDFFQEGEYSAFVTVDVSGRQLAQVSKQQASLGAEWTQTLGDLRAVFRADYAWRSKYYFTEFNTPDAEQAAYGTLNLGMVLRPRQGAWKAYAQLLNVGNSTAITSMNIASPVLGASRQVNYTPPRRVAVGVAMDF
jgi:hypothetical protein